MSHPDPAGPADLRPFRVGDELQNPVTGEFARILELPWENPDGRGRAELLAVVGARVLGEHVHPGMVERFTVLEGELTVRLDGTTRLLPEGETAEIRPGQWHDWWNASDRDIRVLVEVLPGERFLHMIETLFGLAQLGHVNGKGMPNLLQTVMVGREFSDTIQFRSPPPAVQKALFGVLAPMAQGLGYRGTYAQISRSIALRGTPEGRPALPRVSKGRDTADGATGRQSGSLPERDEAGPKAAPFCRAHRGCRRPSRVRGLRPAAALPARWARMRRPLAGFRLRLFLGGDRARRFSRHGT